MRLLRFLGPGLLIGVAILVGYSHPAYAYFGRANNHGYLTDQNAVAYNWTFVPFPPAPYDGLGPGCDTHCDMNLTMFVDGFNARLNDPDQVDAGRAAALIDIMLGQPGSNFNSIQQGIDYAKAHYQDWVDLMTLYDSGSVPGYTVDWNVFMFFGAGTNGQGMQTSPDESNFMGCSAAQGCIGDVVTATGFTAAGFDWAVVFNGPGGQHFAIKHKCANLTGDSTALPIPSSQILISKTSSNPAPMTLGTQMDYNLDVHELSPIPLATVTINDAIPSQFKYIGPAAGTPAPTVSGNQLTWNFTSPADDVTLGKIRDGTETLSVVVQAIAEGSGIVNTATGSAVDKLGNSVAVTPGSTVNTILAVVTPVFKGSSSDIHAGGGLCGQAQSEGVVSGNTSDASRDQYVVSASASNGIINVGSRNAPSGSSGDKLRLGDAGDYLQVCRNDLLAVAMSYYSAHTDPYTIISTSDFDITGKPAGVYFYIPSSTLKIHGVITSKITIVALSGDIEITAPITTGGGSYGSRSVPSLGVIAKGQIGISSAAQQVDAYLFSDDVIDTCVEANSSCLNVLTVNGFIMAKDVALRRLGPPYSSGAVVAESINMNANLYLNPPTFFDSSVDQVLPEGQGERQPLF